ncbi:MAG: polysaccharide pyruvyl transferase family protein [Kiritimatiellae bacterium]|nr:polysaccharide pyruvyl transferase family protein [Kiritimatiellia bacterium]
MKHGVMYYLSKGGVHKNIGDYIQSVAADQFMHATELIEREELYKYAGGKTKVILNGWFMHYPRQFPPSDDVVPLFVAFHMRPKMASRLLTPATVAYMRKYGPVGCRDRTTAEILERHGVPAYFSNCLTLTLGRTFPRAPPAERRGVCFVDPLHSFTKRDALFSLPWLLLHPVMAVRVFVKMLPQALYRESPAFKLCAFAMLGVFLRTYLTLFTKDLILSAEYYTHSVMECIFTDEKSKFDYSRKMLERYSRARFCVTSRIHCALPCVAMGVPVVFVDAGDKNLGEGRFDGVLDLFNVAVARRDRLEPHFDLPPGGKIGADSEIPVKNDFRQYADALAAKCEAFAKDGEA